MIKISLEEAIELANKNVSLTGTELTPIQNCLDKILAEDIYADLDYPPFTRSAMDGYAVKSSDIRHASKNHPVKLKVIETVNAGDMPHKKIAHGTAVRIMTGAMVPPGGDCVVRQEETDYGKEYVQIFQKTEARLNCCMQGEDFRAGEKIMERGQAVDASAFSAIGAAGKHKVRVFKRIKAALITTGDELKEIGEEIGSGEIYDSNMLYLSARLKQLGCTVTETHRSKDDPEKICSLLCSAAEKADLIVTTGGVSVGQKDYLYRAAETTGADIIFHGIAVKPGMPTMFSVLGNVPVLSLSGNPYSAAAMFEFFVPSILAKMQGRRDSIMTAENGRLANGYAKKSSVRRIIRGIIRENEIFVPDKQSNGMLKFGIGCNCLIDIPAGSGELRAGEAVKFYRTY
nr:gephyrin-like molybdotransferase Glp [uncultured Lachnoclostridium sp.]